MRRRPSIGVRWALRNAVLFGIVLFGVATFAHLEVKRRVTEDAKLLLEVEVRDLVEELGTAGLNASQIAKEVGPKMTSAAAPDLELGMQVFDEQGERVYARGELATLDVSLPREIEAAGSRSVFSEIEREGEHPYWVVSAQGAVGYVQMGVSSREFVASASQLGRVLLAAAPVLALLAGLVGWWVARQSLRPLREMVAAARGIGFSRLETRIPRSGNGDELDLLAGTLNDAFSRVEEGAEKLRQLTAQAAHELRTPLTRLRSRMEATLSDEEADAERLRDAVARSVEELRGLSETFAATLLLAESDAGLRPEQKEPVELRTLVEEVVEFYGPMAAEAEVGLHLEAGEDVRVSGMASWLRQALSNLVQNGLAHARSRVSLRLEKPRATEVLLSVEDDGRGIAPEDLPRIFDRFYRGEDEAAGRGNGLGLAIALQMVKAHGGRIEVESHVGRGTHFRVVLPCTGRSARPLQVP